MISRWGRRQQRILQFEVLVAGGMVDSVSLTILRDWRGTFCNDCANSAISVSKEGARFVYPFAGVTEVMLLANSWIFLVVIMTTQEIV